ncbi:MAG TPA: DUF1501 domain-containing protein [Planctomycetaceae bacterium]|nr:DUF1501 domain-containing protein [Planctomycetaceae bacterium]
MLTLNDGILRLPGTRREFFRAGGGLALAGLALPRGAGAASSASGHRAATIPAKSCILVYLLGGPPHQDTFDLKPAAPAEVRGPFSPIATCVPGIEICEHLPLLARLADRYALVRSVSHRNSNHTPMIYYTLTGQETARPEADNDIRPPQRTDFPHMGAVLAKLKRRRTALPGYVAIPEVGIRSSTRGEFKRARTPLRGGGAGFLGTAFEPLAVDGDPGTAGAVPALTLANDVSAARFERRIALLSALDSRGPASRAARTSGELRDQAVVLTGAVHRERTPAFSLDGESTAVRDRYGRHRFGQSLLLARRLTEAGVPMVAIHFNEMTVCDGWDTHSKNFEALESELLPMLDQSLAALLDDLHQRGRLGETLVACFGEFGRTPKINTNAGRDHWGDCSTTLLAGGGIRGGQAVGASDNLAAYPVTPPVDPVDIQATMYRCLGVDPHTTINDHLGRPWSVSTGQVVSDLLA